jgi:hypothetical protein
VYGNATAGYGVYGNDTSSGAGVHGQSSTGNGVAGVSSQTSQTGTKAGVYGENTSGGWAGYFDGPVKVNGALSVNSCTGCSDIRMKRNVKPIGDDAVEQLLKLKGVTFEWIDPSLHDNDSGTVRGFIAQDVEGVFPSWVNDNGYTAHDGTAYRTIDLRQIEALEVESIRKLNAENVALRAMVEKQQAEIDELKADFAKLKNGKDPISGGPGFGPGVLALFAATVAGATGLMLKRLGLSLATVVGLLVAGRKRDTKKLP